MYAKYFTGFHINKNMYLLVTTDLRSFRSLPVKLMKISVQSDIWNKLFNNGAKNFLKAVFHNFYYVTQYKFNQTNGK